MTYRDVLVQIDTADALGRYALAAGLAARGGGFLTGVYLRTSLLNQYVDVGEIGYLPPDDLDRLIREHSQGQAEAAAAGARALQAAAAEAGVACDWRTIDGDTCEALVAEARRADIAVLPRPTAHPAYGAHGSAVDVALGGGGPVLVAPETAAPGPIGRRILLAWNGSRESARALREALPLIEPGAKVTVMTVRPRGADLVPDAGLRRHLRRLGFEPELQVVTESEPAHALIAAKAREITPDLVVMGLYGHARLQEFVLGGASRAMLQAAEVPLLVAH